MVPLREQMERRYRALHQSDREGNQPEVEVPIAFERNYPNLGLEWLWFWVFLSNNVAMDPKSGMIRHHHQHEKLLDRHIG